MLWPRLAPSLVAENARSTRPTWDLLLSSRWMVGHASIDFFDRPALHPKKSNGRLRRDTGVDQQRIRQQRQIRNWADA